MHIYCFTTETQIHSNTFSRSQRKQNEKIFLQKCSLIGSTYQLRHKWRARYVTRHVLIQRYSQGVTNISLEVHLTLSADNKPWSSIHVYNACLCVCVHAVVREGQLNAPATTTSATFQQRNCSIGRRFNLLIEVETNNNKIPGVSPRCLFQNTSIYPPCWKSPKMDSDEDGR